MTLVPAHNLVNGSVPDGGEVMANFGRLYDRANRVFSVGQAVATISTPTKVSGQSDVTDLAPQSITVVEPSVLAISFGSLLRYQTNGAARVRGQLQVVRNGVAVANVLAEHAVLAMDTPAAYGSEVELSVPVSGAGPVSLPTGTHTLAIRASTWIYAPGGLGLQTDGIRFVGCSWSGVVMPA